MTLRRRSPRVDVLVIGAGAVGAACAAALARAGRRVRVLADPSRSTTRVSGGHLLLQSKQPGSHLALARRSLELLAEFVSGREEELLYRRRGSLVLAAAEEEAAGLRGRFEALQAEGVPVEWLAADELRKLEPGLAEDLVAGSYCPLDGEISPPLLAAAWLEDALANGATLSSGARVESFLRDRGAVCGVAAGGVAIEAPAVVLAAGPWSGDLLRMAGADGEIRPRRGVLLRARARQVVAARPLLGASYLPAKWSSRPSEVAFSFQQLADGECVLGGSREFVEFSSDGLESTAAAIMECAARYLPAVRELDWGPPEAGYRPWTPDGLPLIGPSSVPGLYLACGHEGDGITLAAVTGEIITQAVLARAGDLTAPRPRG